jgi:hypothetical protein
MRRLVSEIKTLRKYRHLRRAVIPWFKLAALKVGFVALTGLLFWPLALLIISQVLLEKLSELVEQFNEMLLGLAPLRLVRTVYSKLDSRQTRFVRRANRYTRRVQSALRD